MTQSITGTTTFQRIVDSLAKPAPRAYTPSFRIEKGRWGWLVYDGEQAIGNFMVDEGYAFDIWKLSPFEAPIMANTRPPGAVFDLHTAHNTFINLPITRCNDLTEGVESYEACMQTEWLSSSGAELHMRVSGTFLHGQHIQYDISVTYDPARAQYRFFFDAEMWKLTPAGGEPLNMMLAGALADRPEKRRWTHSIWADPWDRLKRFVHSNVLFSATDYVSAFWRSKNGPLQGAWIAYAAHPEFNPAMLVHETNVPIYFATCSQLFDEHLIWQNAGLDELDEEFFHFVMRTEFVNIPAALVDEFLAEAADPPCPKQWLKGKISLPFHMETVNSFETPVDPWQPEDCAIVSLEDPTCWADDAAHSGTHSLKLTGKDYHGWKRLAPMGAVCIVEPHTRYRLRGWIKTHGVTRFARLELTTYEYTYNNVIDTARSAHITGDSEWTCVEVVLDSGEEAYILPCLALYGEGTAWFDDVALEKV